MSIFDTSAFPAMSPSWAEGMRGLNPDATDGALNAAWRARCLAVAAKDTMTSYAHGKTVPGVGVLTVTNDDGKGLLRFSKHGTDPALDVLIKIGEGKGGSGIVRAIKRAERVLESYRMVSDAIQSHTDRLKSLLRVPARDED